MIVELDTGSNMHDDGTAGSDSQKEASLEFH